MVRYFPGAVSKPRLEQSPWKPENTTYSPFRGPSGGVTRFAESLYHPDYESATVMVGQRV